MLVVGKHLRWAEAAGDPNPAALATWLLCSCPACLCCHVKPRHSPHVRGLFSARNILRRKGTMMRVAIAICAIVSLVTTACGSMPPGYYCNPTTKAYEWKIVGCSSCRAQTANAIAVGTATGVTSYM